MQEWLLTPGAPPSRPKTYPKKHQLRPLIDLPRGVRSRVRSLLYPDDEHYRWLTALERRPRHWNTHLQSNDRLILTQGRKAWRASRVPPGFNGEAWVFRIPPKDNPENEQQNASPPTGTSQAAPLVYTEQQWFKDTRNLLNQSAPHDPVFNIYHPAHGSVISLDDHNHASALYREYTLEADTTFSELADRFFGIEDSSLILNISANRDWQVRWMRQRQQPQRGDTLWVPDGYSIRVHGSSNQARRLTLALQGPTQNETTLDLNPATPAPGHLDPDWQTSFRVQPGDYQLTGHLMEQPDRRRQNPGRAGYLLPARNRPGPADHQRPATLAGRRSRRTGRLAYPPVRGR